MFDTIKNHLVLFILLIILGFILIIGVTIFYFFQESYKASPAQLKHFSIEFYNCISDKENGKSDYEKYIQNKEKVRLIKHPDFLLFWNDRVFFEDLIKPIKDNVVPYEDLYGFCAILTGNYDKIRDRITNESFIPEVESTFSKMYAPCDADQLKKVLLKAQDKMSSHKSILGYENEDLFFITNCMNPYFLFLFAEEKPSMAKCLRASAFYDFYKPDPMP